MKKELEARSDDALNLGVYLILLALTGATLSASLFNHGGRIMAVSVALVIASVKASLIGFYYMNLRRDRALTFAIIGVGLIAVLILLAGILPDMTWARF
ncbi:MAG: cytochrome C oxidase subunit IV family protein [Elusimicrobiota bacterium]